MNRRKYLYVVGSTMSISGCMFLGTNNNIGFQSDIYGSWTTYGYDKTNRKKAPVDNDSNGTVVWTADLGETTMSQSVVHDGKVYVTRGDQLICLEAKTGEEVWRYNESNGNIIESTPTIYNGSIFIHSYSGIHSISFSGEEIWRLELDRVNPSSPVVTNDYIYASTLYQDFTVIDRDENQITYESDLENARSSYIVRSSSIAVGDSQLFLVGVAEKLRSIDRSDYTVNYYPEQLAATFSPVLGNSSVYASANINNIVSVDISTGDIQWHQQTGSSTGNSPVDSSPALDGDQLYVNGEFGVFAYNSDTGTRQWFYETPRSVYTTLSIDDNNVYCGTYTDSNPQTDSRVFALDRDNGEVQWEVKVESGVVAPPTIVQSGVFVECASGKLYAIETRRSR